MLDDNNFDLDDFDIIVRAIPKDVQKRINSKEWYAGAGTIRNSETDQIMAHFVLPPDGYPQTYRELLETVNKAARKNPQIRPQAASLALAESAQLLSPNIGTTSLNQIQSQFDKLQDELTTGLSGVKAEFQRDRFNEFQAGLEIARGLRQIADEGLRTAQRNSALDKLAIAMQNQLDDFNQLIRNATDRTDLKRAQDSLLMAMYAQQMRIRIYIEANEIQAARSIHSDYLPKFRLMTERLVNQWFEPRYAPDQEVKPRGLMLQTFLHIEKWLKGDVTAEDAYIQIFEDGETEANSDNENSNNPWKVFKIGAGLIAITILLTGLAVVSQKAREKLIKRAGEFIAKASVWIGNISKEVFDWFLKELSTLKEDIHLKDMLLALSSVGGVGGVVAWAKGVFQSPKSINKDQDSNDESENDKMTKKEALKIFTAILQNADLAIENFERMETYLAELTLAEDDISAWQARLERLTIDEHGLILTKEFIEGMKYRRKQ